jgi:serine/threonine protein kinase
VQDLACSLAALDLSAFQKERLLGEGASGSVILMHRRSDDTEWALKQMRVPSEEDTRRAILLEAERMLKLRHPSLVEAAGVHIERLDFGRCEVSILMEYCAGGSLEETLKPPSPPLTEARAAELLAQLAVALDFVHANDLVHRDIKPANLLLLADGRTLSN